MTRSLPFALACLSLFAAACVAGNGGGTERSAQAPASSPTKTDRPRCFHPDYPPASALAKEEGEVTLVYDFSAEGRITRIDVLSSSGHDRLDEAAIDNIKSCAFKPGTDKQGHPVPFTGQITFHWRLGAGSATPASAPSS